MALSHLRKIAANINEAGYFCLESDEVTDASNKEQVIVCLRWVDAQFEPHEEFIGLRHVQDITTSARFEGQSPSNEFKYVNVSCTVL